MSKEDNSVAFGVGLLAGVIGGVVAAILYAPKSGEETRKNVENAVSNLAEKYTPEIQEAKKQALTSIDVMRYRLEQQYTTLLKLNKLRKQKKKNQMNLI